MTVYQMPLNDAERMTLLRTAHKAGRSAAEGETYLSEATLTLTQTVIDNFVEAMQSMRQATGQRSAAMEEAKHHSGELAFLVQEARRALRAGVRLGKLPASSLRFYGLSVDGRAESPDRRSEWGYQAEKMLAGDDQAQLEGLPGLTNRAALEVAYQNYIDAQEKFTLAKSNFVSIRTKMQTQRGATDEQIRAVVRELRFNLATEPSVLQREIMRTYGMRFRSDSKGETATEAATEAAPQADAEMQVAD